MLQQTVVKTVIPYYRFFLTKWPTVRDLAKANLDQVLHAWQGLGYYARARNMYKCAKLVSNEFGGIFPDTEDGLLQLPGIGPYTAAAIAAIAFGRKTSPVDGNIERVMSRLFAVEDFLPAAKPRLRKLAGRIASELPRRRPKVERPTRYGVAFCLLDEQGRILLRRRPEEGLLGGMMEVPSTPWRDNRWRQNQIAIHAPLEIQWRKMSENVMHTFTHFGLELTIMTGSGWRAARADEVWQPADALGDLALPTVMKKVLHKAL